MTSKQMKAELAARPTTEQTQVQTSQLSGQTKGEIIVRTRHKEFPESCL
jgi:hypothetical protein